MATGRARVVLAHAAPIALLLAAWALVLPEVVFLGKVYVGQNDRVLQDLPQFELALDALRRFSLPLWNGLSFCGAPLIGPPTPRILFPPNLLAALLFPASLPWAISWLVTLEVAAALLVNYRLFLKVFDGDRAYAAFSALCVSLSSVGVTYIGGEIANLLPSLILLVLWDWQGRRFTSNLLLLTGTLFLLFSGSYPSVILYTVWFCWGVSVARCATPGGDLRRALPLTGLWLAAGVLAAMLTAVALFPFFHLQASSFRRQMGFAEVSRLWGQPWYMLLHLALPHFLGDFEQWPLLERNLELSPVDAFPAYAGAAALLFCLLLARRRAGAGSGWLVAGGLLSLCAVRGPLMILPYLALGAAPVSHGRLAMLLPYCMAFAAPAGLEAFLRADRRGQLRDVIQTFGLGLLVLTVGSGALGWDFSLPAWLPLDVAKDQLVEIARRTREAAVHFAAAALLVSAILWARRAGRVSSHAAKWACVAVLAVDLLVMARRHTLVKRFTSTPWYPPSPLTEFLRLRPDLDRFRAALHPFTPFAELPFGRIHGYQPNLNLAYRLPDVGGYQSLIDRRVYELASWGRPPFAGGFGTPGLRQLSAGVVDSAPMADVFAVKYIVAPDTPETARRLGSFARRVFAHRGGAVYEKAGALARLRLACRGHEAEDTAEAVHRALRSGVDLRAAVVVPPGSPLARGSGPCAVDGAVLSVASEGQERLTVEVESRAPAILVFTETFDPGWRAEIGGREVSIHRANFAFQAVEVPAGRSTVRFRFRFAGFPVAAALTLIAAAILAATAVYARAV